MTKHLSLIALLAIVAFWWSAAIWAKSPEANATFSLGEFLPLLLQMILLALLAAASFPDKIPEEGLNLAEYYQENRVYQWSLFVAYFTAVHIAYVVKTALKASALSDMWVVVPDTIILGLFSLMIFARQWWQVGLGFAMLSTIPIVWSSLTLG